MENWRLFRDLLELNTYKDIEAQAEKLAPDVGLEPILWLFSALLMAAILCGCLLAVKQKIR